MAQIPDKKENARRFAELSLQDRREIGRAVNRGRAVEKRSHAVIAVGVARRQQRFWRFAWLLGPILGLIQLPFIEFEAAMVNLVLGTVMLGGMAAYWSWRARQSEAANLAVAGSRRGSRRGRSANTGHLPGQDDERQGPSAVTEGPRPRPRAPRGRKRR